MNINEKTNNSITITYFTPIVFDKKNKSFKEKAQEFVDGYFHLSGTKAYLQTDGSIKFQNHKPSWKTYFKAIAIFASYLTVVVPVAMFIAKVALKRDLLSKLEKIQLKNNISEDDERVNTNEDNEDVEFEKLEQSFTQLHKKLCDKIGNVGKILTTQEIDEAIAMWKDLQKVLKKLIVDLGGEDELEQVKRKNWDDRNKRQSFLFQIDSRFQNIISALSDNLNFSIIRKIRGLDTQSEEVAQETCDQILKELDSHLNQINDLLDSEQKTRALKEINDLIFKIKSKQKKKALDDNAPNCTTQSKKNIPNQMPSSPDSKSEENVQVTKNINEETKENPTLDQAQTEQLKNQSLKNQKANKNTNNGIRSIKENCEEILKILQKPIDNIDINNTIEKIKMLEKQIDSQVGSISPQSILNWRDTVTSLFNKISYMLVNKTLTLGAQNISKSELSIIESQLNQLPDSNAKAAAFITLNQVIREKTTLEQNVPNEPDVNEEETTANFINNDQDSEDERVT